MHQAERCQIVLIKAPTNAAQTLYKLTALQDLVIVIR